MKVPVPSSIMLGGRLVDGQGVFRLVCGHARKLSLLLFRHPQDAEPFREERLNPDQHRVGDLWHVDLPELSPGMAYVYRVDESEEHDVEPDQWLLDPYALAVAGRPRWGDPGSLQPGRPPRNGPDFPKGLLVDDRYDWEGDRPLNHPWPEAVIYETHLRGMTAHASSGVTDPGTYRGFIQKIPHLRKLGITQVELLPLHEFDEMEYYLEGGSRRNLLNYWGYSPLAFAAPNGRYAAAGPLSGAQRHEFRDLVKALHRAGLEVIVDVVFNHTCEGGASGPTYSLRGLGEQAYYMIDPKDGSYRNFTGCGNTVNANHPLVQDLILNCLRQWVLDFHVDGFRFDLASTLTRGTDGAPLEEPPLIRRISEDPVLRDTKLIAEAWDPGGLYQVGSFPGSDWAEWNGRYRDDVRRFWTGEPGLMSVLASCLLGSPDLYHHHRHPPWRSVNFVTCHDGFTLRDLVSYREKHNEANGENNRDGENHNHSVNHGVEGPSQDPDVLARRLAHQKCLLGTLLLSQGVPMLSGGDELGRTQRGNNNAYCQDNELAWIDWSLVESDDGLLAFTRQVIALRRRFPTLRQGHFLTDRDEGEHPAGLAWRSARGKTPDWAHGGRLGLHLFGRASVTGLPEDVPDLFLVFNAETKPHSFTLPEAVNGSWQVDLSTQPTPPATSPTHKTVRVDPLSLTVLSIAPHQVGTAS